MPKPTSKLAEVEEPATTNFLTDAEAATPGSEVVDVLEAKGENITTKEFRW